MRALVLGGGGFIGSHLVDELLRSSHDVRVLDTAADRYRQPPHAVEYRLGDYANAAVLAEALQDVDTVYHLASVTVPNTSNLDPSADITANLVPSVRLFEQMVRLDVSRVVFLSSGGTVYGNPAHIPVAVDHPVQPLCSYGVVKVATEHYLNMFHQLHGLSPLILRASNPYGPRQGHLGVQGVIATFLHRVLEGEPIQIWGDGHVVRDYVYVRDLARLCVLAGESHVEGTYNAGSGVGYSLNDVVEVVAEVTGLRPEVRYGPSRPIDVERIVLESSQTEIAFHWRPEIALRDGIALHWSWMRQSVKPGL